MVKVSEDYVRAKALLSATTRLSVVSGAPALEKPPKTADTLVSTKSPDLIADAISAWAFGGGARMDWMTPGSPTLVFEGTHGLLGVVRCLLPDWVRCEEVWEGDAQLSDGSALPKVLAALASHTVAIRVQAGLSLAEIAATLRRDFDLSPGLAYLALRKAGFEYVESKEAVDWTLSTAEFTATEAARSAARHRSTRSEAGPNICLSHHRWQQPGSVSP